MKKNDLLPPALPARLEAAERGEELVLMARAREEPLTGWQFSGLCLAGEALREMRFERCLFTGCRFTGAELAGTSFVDVQFKNCDLSAVRAPGIYLCRCRLEGVKALAAQLPDCRLAHVRLQNCIFAGANLTGASLEKVLLADCDFTGASLSECRHKGLALQTSRFVKTSFFKTPLAGLDFTSSQLEGAVVSDTGAELRGAVVNTAQAADLARVLGVVVR